MLSDIVVKLCFDIFVLYKLLVLLQGVRILQASLISTSALTLGLSHMLTKVKEEK